ncbi:MAG: heme-binding protein, partial [Mycobacterium sp.]|nr:heme-binding protein [Mycobacterium sp.]
VSAATSTYLFTHPDVNWFFTSLEGQPRDQIRDDVRTYMDANPQTKADLTGIRQPLVNLSTRCKLPVRLPQLMGLMQAAQQQGGTLPGSLPGALQTAQTLGAPGAALPASPSPASAVTQGNGLLPGPATTVTR